MLALKVSIIVRAIAALAVPLCASGVQAAIVPINFTAPGSILSTQFQQAVQSAFGGQTIDRISGQFRYDSNAPGTQTTSPFPIGTYSLTAPFTIGFFAGTQQLFGAIEAPSQTSGIVVVASTLPALASTVSVNLNSGTFDNPLFSVGANSASLNSLVLTLTDPTNSVITSAALPSEAIWEGLQSALSMQISTNGGTAVTSSGSLPVGSIAVPEPAPLALLATGLMALGWQVRRRKN